MNPHRFVLLLFPVIAMTWLGAAPDVGATFGESALFVLHTRNFADSMPLFEVDTRAPDLLANTGITDPAGSIFLITEVMLKATGGTDGMGAIMYTLVATPVHGALSLGGTALAAGATFTQAAIDNGLLVYERGAGESLSDVFELTVIDGAGHALLSGAILFEIAGVASDAGDPFLIDTRNLMKSGLFSVGTGVVGVLGDNGAGSLRDSIAGATAGDRLTFEAGLSGRTISLGGTQLTIGKDLIIDASTLAVALTISNNGASRVFEIAGAAVTLYRLTVTGGAAGINNGGGIRNGGGADLTLIDSQITGNRAMDGGGIYSSGIGTRLTLIDTTLSGNTAINLGGGICNDSEGTVTLNNTTLSGNTAADGGAICSLAGPFTLNHVTVAGNTATTSAGGIFKTTELETATLNNTIVAGNTAPIAPNINHPFGGSNNLTSGDPLLASLGNFGGPTETMPPLPGSPAIEAATASALTTDQRGNTRPVGPRPDLGAMEAVPFLNLPFLDADNDGIDDRIESAYSWLNVGVDDSEVDFDNDSSPDAEEFSNMTDPNDPADFFRILSFAPAVGFDSNTNPVFDITWTTFPGLSYVLECDTHVDFGKTNVLDSVAPGDFTHNATVLLESNNDFVRVRRE